MTKEMHRVRRQCLAGIIDRIGEKGGGGFIVMWKNWPVLFWRSAVCKHVYSLVKAEEATRFESQDAAVTACMDYGLVQDVRVEKI